MLILLQAIFVSFVILYRSNIWVALIPDPLAVILTIGAYAFFLAVVARRAYFVRYPDHIILLSVLSLLIMLTTQLVLIRGVVQLIGYSLVTALAVITISLWKTNQEIRAIKIFIIFCTIISLLGIIAWFIVNYTFLSQGYVDPAHVINIEEFTGGRMGRGYGDKINVFGVSMDSYSFPYSLGLVLTGSYAYELLGVPFFRASGIFHEPSTAAFMTIPALVLVFNPIYFSKWQKKIILTILLFFIVATMSLSVILSLLSVYMLYNFFVLFTNNLSRTNLIKLSRFVIIIGVIGVLGFYSYNMPAIRGITRNILSSKFGSKEYASIVVNILFDPKYFFTYIYFLTVSLSCAFIAAKRNNNSLMSFSLINISLLIMSLKGYFFHILISPGFFVLFFLMLKNLGKSARLSNLQTQQLSILQRDIPQEQLSP